jgi:SAM-dependent methyltransferase
MTTHASTPAAAPRIADLKLAHRKLWASGDYHSIVERMISDVPPRHLLDRVRVEPGMKVLDLAAGTGNAAIPAAQRGAEVTALDLVPELLDRGREWAKGAGVDIDWVEGDAEDLPFADGAFDCVVSIFGIQFAPRHEVAAREALRVTRPGGTLGLINWTPQGHIGRILKAVGANLPKPPDFASPPPLWGDEAHVDALFAGERVEHERALNPFVGFASAEDWIGVMETLYGPMLTARGKLEPEGRWLPLREHLVALTEAADRGGSGAMHVDSEYLLSVVTKDGG